jgi:lipoate-protein ligase A
VSAPLRVIDTGERPSRWNIAVTEALVQRHRASKIPDTIRFHRYPRSVLIGRTQVLDREVDIEECRRRGVELARRVTGGGAVYMSPSILAWDLVAGRHRFGARLDEVSVRIGSLVAAGLRRLGLPARVTPAGGVEIEGNKVSGASGCFDGPSLLMQSTVLIDFDRVEMAHLLKAHASAAGPVPRVASLADFVARVPRVEEVTSALLAEMSEVGQVPLRVEDLGAEDLTLAAELLANEIGTEAFVLGESAAAATIRLRAAGQ